MLEAIHFLAAASLLLAVPGESGRNGPARRFHARIGTCDVTALAPPRSDKADAIPAGGTGLRSTAFYVRFGRKTVLIAPIGLTPEDRAERGVPDAVILTSLEPGQLVGVMEGEGPAFPGSPLFVDRALVDGAREPGSDGSAARAVFAAYQAIGKLRVTEPDAQPMPGVTIAISPDRQRSESRVRLECGPTTLMFLPGREMTFGPGAMTGRRRPELPRMLASDDFAVALTDGRFPGIGRVYAEHDGYHWGSIEARLFGGVPRVRGEVTVEVADNGRSAVPKPGHAGDLDQSCVGSAHCKESETGTAASPR